MQSKLYQCIIRWKLYYKAVGGSCAGCTLQTCSQTRAAESRVNNSSVCSRALQHTRHTACLQHCRGAPRPDRNCSMQRCLQHDKILITVPEQNARVKAIYSVACLFVECIGFRFNLGIYLIKTFTGRTKKRLGPHNGSDKKLVLTNVQHFLRMSQQKN